MAELSHVDYNGEVLEIADAAAREDIKKLQEAQGEGVETHAAKIANAETSGHVKLSNSVNSFYGVDDGWAATPLAIKTVNDKAEEAQRIAKGRNQGISYESYQVMVEALNAMEVDELHRGQDVLIGTVGVPDLWIYGVVSSKSEYTYVSDDAIVSAIETNVYMQIGYYLVAFLETQKVDLTDVNAKIAANEAAAANAQATADSATKFYTIWQPESLDVLAEQVTSYPSGSSFRMKDVNNVLGITTGWVTFYAEWQNPYSDDNSYSVGITMTVTISGDSMIFPYRVLLIGTKASGITLAFKKQVASMEDVNGRLRNIDITTAVDLNTLQTTGVYHIANGSCSNMPSSSWGTLYADFTVGTPYQIYMPDGATSGYYKRSYVKNTDSWTAWVCDYTDLKKSVSDGKSLIASAITENGVTTAADATFAVMASNLSNIRKPIRNGSSQATDIGTGTGGLYMVFPYGYYPSETHFQNAGTSEVYAPYTSVASVLGITADKIVEGNTISGVTGNRGGYKVYSKECAFSEGTWVSGSMPLSDSSYKNLANSTYKTSTWRFKHGLGLDVSKIAIINGAIIETSNYMRYSIPDAYRYIAEYSIGGTAIPVSTGAYKCFSHSWWETGTTDNSDCAVMEIRVDATYIEFEFRYEGINVPLTIKSTAPKFKFSFVYQ